MLPCYFTQCNLLLVEYSASWIYCIPELVRFLFGCLTLKNEVKNFQPKILSVNQRSSQTVVSQLEFLSANQQMKKW